MMTNRVVCDTAKVRFFKQITTQKNNSVRLLELFAILQKYDFSSKSQLDMVYDRNTGRCLRYCKSTIFQANHNSRGARKANNQLFAILQKYDFSSKSQQYLEPAQYDVGCLRYCKSTIFQANHNCKEIDNGIIEVVCDTAKVRFFKQITTPA